MQELFDYVMERCDRTGGMNACWPWMHGTNRRGGYGRTAKGGRNILTHRIVWQHTRRRTIPAGKRVLHRCDNPPCCNPRHLFLGTQRQNVADMIRKGRHRAPVSERARTAIFTPAQACAIFLDQRPHVEIGRAIGVNAATVSHIKARRTWRKATAGLVAPKCLDGRRERWKRA